MKREITIAVQPVPINTLELEKFFYLTGLGQAINIHTRIFLLINALSLALYKR